MKNHLRTIEQLKTDLQISRSNHEQEIHRLQSDLEVLSQELQTTKADLSESQSTVMEQRTSIACMTDEIERMSKQQDSSTREVRMQTKKDDNWYLKSENLKYCVLWSDLIYLSPIKWLKIIVESVADM